ncbi:ATP-binding protein [Nocardiopsis sp. L17-MgMaSL7]|uniref:ATP-binding protein n=1 Tax=Nocardiopsis sp. L17-MgMaSL7 TaxID=1938893 RepID=UPI000D71185A|nr:ATP-binding protein [Nocardiopsis sp. L17-MgMaSL7]PWV58025.1 histidine kinase-like protein [Nocardiopsis sp. L17-MgMaSL7]
MSVFSPELAHRETTVPLASFIKPFHAHYFSRTVGTPFRKRKYAFAGLPGLMPLVRAFLDTSAAERSPDYRYLFTLLGSELANNALTHSLSSEHGGTYTLTVDRDATGMTLTCQDQGTRRPMNPGPLTATHLDTLRPTAGSANGQGLGLGLVSTLADQWGDNGNPKFRQVWFHLSYDLTDTPWNDINTDMDKADR